MMHTYKSENNHAPTQYSTEQLGLPVYYKKSTRSKTDFGVVVIDNNNQIKVMAGCGWGACRKRVQEMVRAGVDPCDIKAFASGVSANSTMPEGKLVNVNVPLWWTRGDQELLDKERESD